MMTNSWRFLLLPALALAASAALGGCTTSLTPGGFNTVVIDAGHGGYDNGGRSRSGLQEKNLALDTARRLQPILNRAGFRTALTRSSDYFVELDDRVSFANRYPDGILVSIHYNASPNSRPRGVETFYWRPDSYGLAQRVETNLVRATRFGYRGATRRVLRLTRNPSIPSVLVECGFLTNPDEASTVADGAFRQRIAQGIADGIIEEHNRGDYARGTLRPPSPPQARQAARASRDTNEEVRQEGDAARAPQGRIIRRGGTEFLNEE